jgi:hypothetical protein
MKTEKIKEVSEALNSAFDRSARRARYHHWGIKPRNKSLGAAPSALELATLAAALARTAGDDPQKLCSNALNLWFASKEAISLQNKCNEDCDSADAKIEAELLKNPLPDASEFPMELDEFMKRIWPDKSPKERTETFKLYLNHGISIDHFLKTNRNNSMSPIYSYADYPVSQKEIESEYAKLVAEKIPMIKFGSLRDDVLRWHREYKPKAVSMSKRQNALKRWDKEKALCDEKDKKHPKYLQFLETCPKGKPARHSDFIAWLEVENRASKKSKK